MEQTYEDLTQNLKCENENSNMDIEGTVIKVEMKSPLTHIHMLPNERKENANLEKHDVEIKNEKLAHHQNEKSQNALLIEKTINIKLEEFRSYICAKKLNSEKNSSALKRKSPKTAKVTEQNICEICKNSFSRKSYLKLHVKAVHDELQEHKCDICSKIFGRMAHLQFHEKTVHENIKAHKCVLCNKKFCSNKDLETHVKTVHLFLFINSLYSSTLLHTLL